MSQKEIIAKLVKQYIQIQSIEEEIKEIKAEAKAAAKPKKAVPVMDDFDDENAPF